MLESRKSLTRSCDYVCTLLSRRTFMKRPEAAVAPFVSQCSVLPRQHVPPVYGIAVAYKRNNKQ